MMGLLSRRWLGGGMLVAAVIGLTLFASGCGDEDSSEDGATATAPSETAVDGETPVDGGATATPAEVAQMSASLTNEPFAVTLSQGTVPAGSVNIQVTNDGTVGHNFYVIKTDLAVGDLPMEGSVVDIEALDVVTYSGLVTNDENLDPGDRLQVLAQLEAGSYVLLCNVPDHYAAGMRAALVAQ